MILILVVDNQTIELSEPKQLKKLYLSLEA